MIVQIVLWTLFGNGRNYLLFYPLVCYTYYRKFLINCDPNCDPNLNMVGFFDGNLRELYGVNEGLKKVD